MKKKTIVLHIGLPKTGTTALQQWCHENRMTLRESGVDYPDLVESDEDPKHQFLVHEMKSGSFGRLGAALNESTCEKIFLSTEGLSNQFLDFTPEQLAAFRKVVSDFSVIVFVVSRHWPSWVGSYYNQCVINPPVLGYPYATKLSCDDFSKLERVRYLGNLPSERDTLRSAFGADDVVSGEYEGNWLGLWGDLVGYPITDEMLAQRNNSPDADMIGLILEVNRSAVSDGARSLLLAAIQRAYKSNNTILSSYSRAHYVEADRESARACVRSLRQSGSISTSVAALLEMQLVKALRQEGQDFSRGQFSTL